MNSQTCTQSIGIWRMVFVSGEPKTEPVATPPRHLEMGLWNLDVRNPCYRPGGDNLPELSANNQLLSRKTDTDKAGPN